MKLRDYQLECLQTIYKRYKSGIRRQLICLPTGTGKTVIFASFPKFFQMKKRMLVLAHREELLDQARDKITTSNPELKVEIEQADRSAGLECDVVVASIPTLGRKGSNRLARLDPDQFYLIVVDEAHHSVASTYRRILEHFDLFNQQTQKLLVGFTATPKRGDRQGLGTVFEEISYAKSLPEMIQKGYLAPVSGYRVETEVDLSKVAIRMGDFVARQLSSAVNITARNKLVINVFNELLADRQTLCFCVDVAHSKGLAEDFRRSNISAAAITGEMTTDARRKLLDDFSQGRIRVLTNCMVLTEGYDESQVAGIIVARPTKSSLLYTQMIGRGMRIHPGKENSIIIDIVDITKDHRVVTLPSLFGLSEGFNLEGNTTSHVQNALDWVNRHRTWVRTDRATSLSDLRYRCTKIDLLELALPQRLIKSARFAWTETGPNAYRLALADGEHIDITPTILGNWEILLSKGSLESPMGTVPSLNQAIRIAEKWVNNNRLKSRRLVLLGTKWRKAPASEKQIRVIRSRGITVPRKITKGQASHLISILFGPNPHIKNQPSGQEPDMQLWTGILKDHKM